MTTTPSIVPSTAPLFAPPLQFAQSTVGAVRIGFEYDPATEICVAYPCCHLTSADDVLSWFQAYANYFEPQAKKLDVVFVLEMFSFAPEAARDFDRARQRLLDTYTRHSVRVASDAHATLHMAASDEAAYGVLTFAPDVPSAVALIQRWRSQGFEHGK